MILTASLVLSLIAGPSLSVGHPQPDREPVLKAAVAEAESIRPANLQRLDDAILDLARFLQGRGRYREAEALYVRSNTINQDLHGPSSRESAWSLMRLGAIYHAELTFDKAEPVTRRAVELFQSLAGPESLEYAIATANLAVILADQGQPARAEPILRRALFLIRKHAPENDPVIACVEANLGLVYLRQGEPRKAEPLLRAALEKFELTNDPGQASTLAALAELSIAEQRWIEADARIQQAYRLTVALLGEDHPWLSGILHLKARIEDHTGDSRQAAADMKRSLELLDAIAGPDSATSAAFLEDYALFLRHLGRKGEAKAVTRRARAIKQSALK